MALVEHSFLGTWEIVSCTFEGNKETSGLEGIKFRLDDNSDITWFNDLINPLLETHDCNSCCDSANVLLTCETFEVNENPPRITFGAFAGHSIEFNTTTVTPSDTLTLLCENWYALECKRLKEDQAAGQEKEFSFIECLNDDYFSDVIIKSSDGYEYHVHACILRLNGFDCSMCLYSNSPSIIPGYQEKCADQNSTRENVNISETSNSITISVTHAKTTNFVEDKVQVLPSLNVSPIHLKVSPAYQAATQLNIQCPSKLSSSYNCLLSNSLEVTVAEAKNLLTFNNSVGVKHHVSPTSRSDSHLESHHHETKNIFNFCQDLMLQQSSTTDHSVNNMCPTRRPPLSPFRARSPSPFLTSAIDTPPPSPLTPVSVLNDLPASLLTPILHWLYTECVLGDMEENVCEKLINFAECQPTLTKMTESFKKYSKLIKLKKFVIDIFTDLHNILNRTIQSINPDAISHDPRVLYDTYKDCIKDCLLGCVKMLQFCNIFIKDGTDIARYQKNEIIKYVRTRIPIFITQLHQLLDNILKLFLYLPPEEKSELANFLIPEVENTLVTLTNLMEEINNSLEKMCKNLKCSHLDLSLNNEPDNATMTLSIQNNSSITKARTLMDEQTVNDVISRQSCGPPIGLTLYGKNHSKNAENDLKFVLYMYEMRKMRDIYGRISAALTVMQQKKNTFISMDYITKRNTIYDNINHLIGYIPKCMDIMEMLAERIEGKLGWKEFKFCFKLVTSQINGVLKKIFEHKLALKDALIQVCSLVQKQEFTQSLIDLGLLEQTHNPESEENVAQNITSKDLNVNVMLDATDFDYAKIKLNLVRHLCEPPAAAQSTLSKNALRLLHSGQLTDMEFLVHSVTSDGNTSTNNHNIHTFRAHRIIVASRCDCFKKALMSGMQESITRKIIINDTSPVIFRRLLLYLYGAPIDKTVGAEQICELMLLADKYSVIDLKELCENTLNALIDDDSVLCLLNIADHYMATALKTKCLSYLAQRSYITKTIMFKELTNSLQLEVMDLIHWYGRVAEPWSQHISDLNKLKSDGTSRRSLRHSTPAKRCSRKLSPC